MQNFTDIHEFLYLSFSTYSGWVSVVVFCCSFLCNPKISTVSVFQNSVPNAMNHPALGDFTNSNCNSLTISDGLMSVNYNY